MFDIVLDTHLLKYRDLLNFKYFRPVNLTH